MEIRGFLPTSLNEWEGRVAAVVFAPGCNWRCPYCHGWRLVTDAASLPRIEEETVFADIAARKGWIDGVVVSGGEATLQPGLAAFLRRARGLGLQTKLETNGTRPGVLAALLAEKLLDCLCLDLKAPLDALAGATGVEDPEAAAVQESFALAAGSGIEREYHTTLCPAFVDEAALTRMAGALEPGGLWVLQQYNPGDCLAPDRAGERRYDDAELDRLEAIARAGHAKVMMRRGK